MNNTTPLSKKLKNLISKYEHKSFIAHWSFLSNMHYRNKDDGKTELISPVRQLMYLISLYHSTEFGGNEYFEAYGKEYDEIILLLNQIEKTYAVKPDSAYMQNQETANKLFISNSTFLNYYLNAPLSYIEQDIERIRRTFMHFESFIQSECGLVIEDFLSFYILISNLEIERYNNYYDHTEEEKSLIIKAGTNPSLLTKDEAFQLIEIVDKGLMRLAIPITTIKQYLPSEKVDLLLSYFTLLHSKNDEYLYYADSCPYLTKPILLVDSKHILFIYSKQLVNAIYDFLFEVCSGIDENGRRVLAQRENYLEYKTQEIFTDFFGNEAKIYTNYVISDSEKDILVLTKNYAFIVECKANKYRIPFRDPIKAYDRIKDDFKKSIGKGYLQAKEVKQYFTNSKNFEIRNEKRQVIDVIKPNQNIEVFSIIVTHERFGQIQCDLSHLLELDNDDKYPWSVSIDDLETFLITLNRKKNHIEEFITFLKGRERLHSRLFCFDELELCSNFIMQPHQFKEYCYHTWPFISQNDLNRFFDDLYTVGFGFKDEINIEEKPSRYSPIANALIKELNLQRPLRLR